ISITGVSSQRVCASGRSMVRRPTGLLNPLIRLDFQIEAGIFEETLRKSARWLRHRRIAAELDEKIENPLVPGGRWRRRGASREPTSRTCLSMQPVRECGLALRPLGLARGTDRPRWGDGHN